MTPEVGSLGVYAQLDVVVVTLTDLNGNQLSVQLGKGDCAELIGALVMAAARAFDDGPGEGL